MRRYSFIRTFSPALHRSSDTPLPPLKSHLRRTENKKLTSRWRGRRWVVWVCVDEIPFALIPVFSITQILNNSKKWTKWNIPRAQTMASIIRARVESEMFRLQPVGVGVGPWVLETDIRDGHGTVINCTRGSSCLLILRFVSQALMYSCPFRRCQFSDLLSLHRWTNSHGSWEYRQGIFCFAKHAWKMSFVGGATRSCLGALGFHGSPSTYLIFFALRTRLRFPSSAGRWRYRWDMLDNKFVERNETRRHGGMYSIAIPFFSKPSFWDRFKKSRICYTKSFKWIIIEIRNTKKYRMFYGF